MVYASAVPGQEMGARGGEIVVQLRVFLIVSRDLTERPDFFALVPSIL